MTSHTVRFASSALLATLTLVGLSIVTPSCSSWTDSPGYAPFDGGVKRPDSAADPVVFKRDIRPLINRTNVDATGHGCKLCHYTNFWGDKGFDSSGFDVTTLGALRQGGYHTRDNIIVPYDCPGPGEQPKSAFVQKLRGTFYLGAKMPKDGPPFWSEDQIRLVERWICEGAKGDDSE